jgi:glycolate oxidase iron-sulfur subunit
LDAIPGLKRVDLAESDWCCGSAGIYNITQPEQANKLLQRKLGHIHATGADIVATSNPGCHLQLQNGLARGPRSVSVEHPVTLLAKAYRRELDKSP